MSNDYYNAASPFTKNTLARAATGNAALAAIAAGFDKLPAKLALDQDRLTYASDSGSANAYAVALPKTLASYTTGMKVRMYVGNTNTGASTLDVDSLGARAIKLIDGTDVSAGDLTAGDIVELIYNGTTFYLNSPSRAHMAGVATTLAGSPEWTGNPDFSGNPVFSGNPDFSGAGNKSTIRSDLGLEILGTVAESSGVPTGALQESDTGANGYYWRFANGLQVCTHELTVSYAGAGYMTGTWTYPAAFSYRPSPGGFVNIPDFLANATPSSLSDIVGVKCGTTDATSTVLHVYRATGTTDFVSGDTSLMYVFAIGRWHNNI